MNLSDIPYKFQSLWAALASGSFITNPIPLTSASPAASQQLGFPPATATPTGSGGTPPNIDDFNGAFYYLSAWLRWNQAGGEVQYDAAFAAAFGGYPYGARLNSSVTPGLVWRSIADGNNTNPDVSSTFWVNDFASVQAASGGQNFVGGNVEQWVTGSASFTAGGLNVTLGWQRPFPHNCFNAVYSLQLVSPSSGVILSSWLHPSDPFDVNAIYIRLDAYSLPTMAAAGASVVITAWGIGN